MDQSNRWQNLPDFPGGSPKIKNSPPIGMIELLILMRVTQYTLRKISVIREVDISLKKTGVILSFLTMESPKISLV